MEKFMAYFFYLIVLAMIVFVIVMFKVIGESLNKAVEKSEEEEKLNVENMTLKDIETAAKNFPNDVGILYEAYKSFNDPQWHSQEFMNGYLHSCY
jgi:hypothetical protein